MLIVMYGASRTHQITLLRSVEKAIRQTHIFLTKTEGIAALLLQCPDGSVKFYKWIERFVRYHSQDDTKANILARTSTVKAEVVPRHSGFVVLFYLVRIKSEYRRELQWSIYTFLTRLRSLMAPRFVSIAWESAEVMLNCHGQTEEDAETAAIEFFTRLSNSHYQVGSTWQHWQNGFYWLTEMSTMARKMSTKRLRPLRKNEKMKSTNML